METKKVTLTLEETNLNNIINYLRRARRFEDKIDACKIELDVCKTCNLDEMKKEFIMDESEKILEKLNKEISKSNPDFEEIKRLSNLLNNSDESPVE